MKASGHTARSPFKFFVLVFAIAIPIELASRFLGVIGDMKIPVADLGLGFVPMIARNANSSQASGNRDAPPKARQ